MDPTITDSRANISASRAIVRCSASASITSISISEWTADQIASAVHLCRARGWAEPASNQPQYNALWRRVEDRVFPTCRELGLGNVVWSPLAMGVLSGKYTSVENPPADTRAGNESQKWTLEEYFTESILDAVQQLKPLAERAQCTLAQLALAWCLREDVVSSVIVGATKVAQWTTT